MPRTARETSELDLYHVMGRGVGKCIIYESDDDRSMFVRLLQHSIDASGVILHAWCLMDNHYHLVVGCTLDKLATFMRTLNSSYATYYNANHERVGHLFQGRFKSQPIGSEAQLLCAVRYVHQNPLSAGMTRSCSYRWSSFDGYTSHPRLVDNTLVLSLFSSREDFFEFHASYDAGASFIDIDDERGITSQRVIDVAQSALRTTRIEEISGLSRALRDEALRILKQCNLSTRQIERLTGVPKSIVARA